MLFTFFKNKWWMSAGSGPAGIHVDSGQVCNHMDRMTAGPLPGARFYFFLKNVNNII